MARKRMTDEQWELIGDIFPPPAKTGRPPVDRRNVVDGIFWMTRAGAAWRDLPTEFGKWGTVWDLFDTWNRDGTLDKILNRLRSANFDLNNGENSLWCVDGTIVRAARCAAGGGKKGIPMNLLTTH